jgi:hypothetical protein
MAFYNEEHHAKVLAARHRRGLPINEFINPFTITEVLKGARKIEGRILPEKPAICTRTVKPKF